MISHETMKSVLLIIIIRLTLCVCVWVCVWAWRSAEVDWLRTFSHHSEPRSRLEATETVSKSSFSLALPMCLMDSFVHSQGYSKIMTCTYMCTCLPLVGDPIWTRGKITSVRLGGWRLWYWLLLAQGCLCRSCSNTSEFCTGWLMANWMDWNEWPCSRFSLWACAMAGNLNNTHLRKDPFRNTQWVSCAKH